MKILFATSNKHKVLEANNTGKKFVVEFEQIDEPYPEIRDDLVLRVAEAGVEYVYNQIKKPVIVEDSGLYIDALNGFPGSYSRFVYDKIGCEGILDLMCNKKERGARFICAVGYCDAKGVRVFQGVVEGSITKRLEGDGGFGYDPIFRPRGYVKTFAEDVKLKGVVSHRSQAFEKLCVWLGGGGR